MISIAIVEKKAANGQKFFDVMSSTGHIEYSTTLLPAAEAYVVGWQRGSKLALAVVYDEVKV